MSKYKSCSDFMRNFVVKRNPQQVLFHQAVRDAFEGLFPFIQATPKFYRDDVLERFVEPERVVIFRVPWVDQQGDFQINTGYRVEFNSAIGPYKGGLRFHPTVDLSTLKFLAFEQCLKNSLTTLPMGAGDGGSDFDPKGKSDVDVQAFCQSFMTELCRHIGPNTDVPGGDVGVGKREIGYLFGQYKRIRNEFTGVLTGKKLEWGGSLIREESTGYGVVYFAESMMATRSDGFKGKKVVVSGSGNVSQFAIERSLDYGATILTASDSSGFIYDPEGIDYDKLSFIKRLKNIQRGRISEYVKKYPKAEFHAGERPWGVKCDIALPCATQNEVSGPEAQILLDNGCKVVAEGANMPSEYEAQQLYIKHKILYGPGKAANAGGVSVSGLEMTQNNLRTFWERDDVDAKLKQIMSRIHEQCVKYGNFGEEDQSYCNYVKGANIAGFIKVANSMIDQGCV